MRCYSHLSDDERELIGLDKALAHSIGAIAQAIGRPKSTISRELSRNKLPSGRYSPLHAAGAYQLRRRRDALIERDRALRTFVVDRLAEGWTPEQISGWLKAGNEHRLPVVGCETIYAFIYRAAQRAEQLWRYLTRRHKRRRPRQSRPSQRGFAMPMPRGKRAESKTPTVDYAAGCLVRSTSTKCPTKKSRTSSSPQISRPENAWASRPLSRRSSKSLAKTCKSGSLSLLHLDLESRHHLYRGMEFTEDKKTLRDW